LNSTSMSTSPAQSFGQDGRFTLAAVLTVMTAAFFLHPLALLLFTCLVAVICPTDALKWLFLAAAGTVFMILALSKQVDGDLINYVTLQDYISQQPLMSLLNKNQLQALQGTYRVTEVGFYAPFWVLSSVIPDSKTAIAIGATLAIYIPTFLGLLLIGKSEKWSNGLILTVALFTFFAGINFLQTTHLIRQYISAAFLFSGFALFISGRRLWAAMACIYACSVHNGTAPLLVVLFAICWMFRFDRIGTRSLFGNFLRLLFSLSLMGGAMAAIPFLQGAFSKEDVPNIKIGHYIVVGVFFLVVQLAIRMQKLRSRTVHYARLIFLVVFMLSLGFFFLGLALDALRYFVYLEWLYGLMVGAMIFAWFRNSPGLQVMTRFAVSLAAAAILVGRIGTSEWMYGPGDNYLLNWDFLQVSKLVSR
jgi:hypothetical protein